MAAINGTNGDDRLTGTGNDDVIDGGAGHDDIAGGAGKDTIHGGEGDDDLSSHDLSLSWTSPFHFQFSDPPLLDRGTEADTIFGGGGNDQIFAGFNDSVDGGSSDVFGDSLLISFMGSQGGVTVDFNQSVNANGSGTISGIELVGWVEGSDFADTITMAIASFPYPDSAVVFGMGGNDTLIAGFDTVYLDGGDGDDIIDGRASSRSIYVWGADGADVIYGPTDGYGYIRGDAGDDRIFASGYVYGGTGNDLIQVLNSIGSELRGESGDDVIEGNEGVDQLWGDGGSDTLTGGGDGDDFHYNAEDGQDVITDFSVDDRVFVQGHSQIQSIVQSGADVILTYSSTDSIRFLNTTVDVVEPRVTMFEIDDKLFGTAGDDEFKTYGGSDFIEGYGGADLIDGGAGDDTLFSYTAGLFPWSHDAGTEHDVLIGGAGDDKLYAGFGDDVDGGEGNDVVALDFSAASSGIAGTFAASLTAPMSFGGGTIQNVETISHLIATAFADTLTIQASGMDFSLDSGDGDDILSVDAATATIISGAGNDNIVFAASGEIWCRSGNDLVVLTGGDTKVMGEAGDDVIKSGSGPDQISGGDGWDWVSYELSDRAIALDLTFGTASDGDYVEQVENIIGSDFNDELTGSSGNNQLLGAAGNDVIFGDDGDDTLDGGVGDDTLKGGLGNDIYVIDSASDMVTEVAGQGVDEVRASVSHTLGSNLENAVLQGDAAINLTGNAQANRITGNAGTNLLDGGGGNDTLAGGDGVDTFVYRTGGGRDVISDFAAGETIDIFGFASAQSVSRSGSSVIVTLANGSQITLHDSTVAAVQAALHFQGGSGGGGGGGGGGTITGTSGSDRLTGTAAVDIINGLAGNDRLSGLAGNDVLRGGLGADTLTGGTGNDLFRFERGGGNDKVTDFARGSDKLDLSLVTGASVGYVKWVASRGNTTVSVDADHNGRADFTITLVGVSALATDDFIFG